jgi:hypothetical protein
MAFVPTGVGSRYAAATSPPDSSAPQRTVGRRQHRAATARHTRLATRAWLAAKDWRPPFPKVSPTTMVGSPALAARITPDRRWPDRMRAAPQRPRNSPATGLVSAPRTASPAVRRRRQDASAKSAPSPTARPTVKVLRVVARLPVRHAAPVTAPATRPDNIGSLQQRRQQQDPGVRAHAATARRR